VETTLEEVLRYRSSFTQLIRVTMVKTELGGQIIPADTVVTPWLLSANRDEREFPHPDRFDIHRSPHHLAFGHGIHFCIGQLLARVEARVAVGDCRQVIRPHRGRQIWLRSGVRATDRSHGLVATVAG
jgi:cytochrome P450